MIKNLIPLKDRNMTTPYAQAIDPISVNINPQKINQIITVFNQQHHQGAFAGGQLVIRRYGQVIANVNIGLARPNTHPNTPPYVVQATTPFPVYSSGKPLAAIAIALSEDRGLLDVNAPIGEILPEFSKQGKEKITTLHVLTHTAGILIPNSYTLDPEKKLTWQTIVDTKPMYPCGTFAYMPIEYGVILSEIIKKLTGKTLAEFVHSEIAQPLNCPALQYGLGDRDYQTIAYSSWLGQCPIRVYGTVIVDNIEKSINDQTCFTSMNPAYTMITDASSLALFYEFLVRKGLTPSGKRLISEQIIEKYTTRSVSGWNKTLNVPLAMGRGFTMGRTWFPSAYGWWNSETCFGHGGMFSSLGFGDHKTQLAAAIITNGNRSIFDFYRRFIPLSHSIRNACL